MGQADNYRSQADNLRSQVEGMASELRGYKSEYSSYMAEGQTNLANLKIAAEQLTSAAGSRYGAAKIKEALTAARQRMVYNQNLINGCQKRISWIDSICGPGDGGYTKVKRR